MKGGFPGVGRLMGIQQGLERPPGLATRGVTTSLPQGQGREQMQTPERELEGEGCWGGGPLPKEPGHGRPPATQWGRSGGPGTTSLSFMAPVSHRASPGQAQPEAEGRQAIDTGQSGQPEGTESRPGGVAGAAGGQRKL